VTVSLKVSSHGQVVHAYREERANRAKTYNKIGRELAQKSSFVASMC
jgi:hypothetical protein